MFCLNDTMRYWLCPEMTDMRKGISSLCRVVREKMGGEVRNGDVLFFFVGQNRRLMRLIHAEDGGILMYVKRLEAGRFKLPDYDEATNSYPMEWLNRQLFGRKSERSRIIDPNQTSLFGEEQAQQLKQAEEVTRVFELKPGKLYIREIVREKWGVKDNTAEAPEGKKGVMIALMPLLPINKGNAGPSLLADILVSKYEYHMPYYRQVKQYSHHGMKSLTESTLNGWFKQTAELLRPPHGALEAEVMKVGYVQADETTTPVIDRDSHKAAKEYVFLRHFEQALDENRPSAEHALAEIQNLYKIEHMCDDAKMTPDERKAKHQELSKPIMEAMRVWMETEGVKYSESSLIGKAVTYAYTRWGNMTRILEDGRLLLDNNLAENEVRSIALGRKNHLFCANHEAARNMIVICSLLATCRNHDVNPRDYPNYVIASMPYRTKATHEELVQLLSHKWKEQQLKPVMTTT